MSKQDGIPPATAAKRSYVTYILGVLVLLAAYGYQAHIKPLFLFLGEGQVYHNINNQECRLIPELSGCEDQWIDRQSGLSYVACTPTTSLKHDFFPPTHHLNTTNFPRPFTQDNMGSFFALIDTKANDKVTKLRVEGLPEAAHGLWVLHGLDVWVDRTVTPPRATVFAINHRPPAKAEKGDNKDALKHGADSVIEVFETELGSEVLTWKETFRHKDVKTPNNIVAVSATSFYVTNDHKEKTSFIRRNLHPLLAPTTNIMYCTIEHNRCFVAHEGLNYPNGITKGPGIIYYAASSAKGVIYVFHQEIDMRLLLVNKIQLGKIADNIHVTEEGHIIVALITKLKAFHEAIIDPIRRRSTIQPVQAMRVSNGTTLLPTVTQHYKIETIFEDPGTGPVKLQTATNVQYYNEKIYLTSCWSDALAVCKTGKI